MDAVTLGFGVVGFTLMAGIFLIYFVTRLVCGGKCEEEPVKVDISERIQKNESPKAFPKSRKGTTDKRKEVKDQYSHPWLMCNLKGHSGPILDLDYSPNGKFLASCSNDRTVMLWSVKSFTDKNHKSIRANVEFDHGTKVKWSPDGKAFIICTASENVIRVYKVGKKKDGTMGSIEVILTFPEHHHAEIIDIGIACNGLFIMSCSADTTLIVWDLKGQVLATIDTLHINNYHACISPCGRFVAASGFISDVRVWEVCFSKTGEFKEVKRAFELKGHTSGVYNFSFSSDSLRMVTISKDGTLKLWDTNIEYSKGQEPYLLLSTKYDCSPDSMVALSPDGRTIATCLKSDIRVYSAVTGELQAKLEEIHQDPIKSLLFSPDGQYIIAAAGRHIRIFHNLPGYKNLILGFEKAKKSASSQTIKERLQSQIDEAKLSLRNLEKIADR